VLRRVSSPRGGALRDRWRVALVAPGGHSRGHGTTMPFLFLSFVCSLHHLPKPQSNGHLPNIPECSGSLPEATCSTTSPISSGRAGRDGWTFSRFSCYGKLRD